MNTDSKQMQARKKKDIGVQMLAHAQLKVYYPKSSSLTAVPAQRLH